MIDNAEFGYTPKNLRELRKKYGLTQKDVAKITETKNQQSADRWEAELDAARHADMPYRKWIMLLEFTKSLQ